MRGHPREPPHEVRITAIADQDRGLERDQPDVLHRAEEPRDRDQIELGPRQRLIDVALDRLDERGQRRDRRRDPGRLGRPHRDPQRDPRAADGATLDHGERPDREREQVARQRPDLGERDLAAAVGQHALAGDRRVPERRDPIGHDQRDRPRRLEPGLVEARQDPPGEDRLALRIQVPVAIDLLAEQADVLRRRAPGVLEHEDQLARPGRGRQREPDQLVAGRGHRRQRAHARAVAIARRGDRELDRVEPHHRGRRLEPRADLDPAAERVVIGIELEPERVRDRRDPGGQPQPGRPRGRGRRRQGAQARGRRRFRSRGRRRGRRARAHDGRDDEQRRAPAHAGVTIASRRSAVDLIAHRDVDRAHDARRRARAPCAPSSSPRARRAPCRPRPPGLDATSTLTTLPGIGAMSPPATPARRELGEPRLPRRTRARGLRSAPSSARPRVATRDAAGGGRRASTNHSRSPSSAEPR